MNLTLLLLLKKEKKKASIVHLSLEKRNETLAQLPFERAEVIPVASPECVISDLLSQQTYLMVLGEKSQ